VCKFGPVVKEISVLQCEGDLSERGERWKEGQQGSEPKKKGGKEPDQKKNEGIKEKKWVDEKKRRNCPKKEAFLNSRRKFRGGRQGLFKKDSIQKKGRRGSYRKNSCFGGGKEPREQKKDLTILSESLHRREGGGYKKGRGGRRGKGKA